MLQKGHSTILLTFIKLRTLFCLFYISGPLRQVFTGPRSAVEEQCLTIEPCLPADPGVASSIPARSHSFVEIEHGKISTVNPFPSADSFKKDCCQLQAKVCARSTG